MAEATQYTFTHQELIKLLIKEQGLHEGVWQLIVNFGFAGSNVGPSVNDLNPAAVVAVGGIGIQRATGERTNLTVDAAEVNPA
jgi:hypothetical protein